MNLREWLEETVARMERARDRLDERATNPAVGMLEKKRLEGKLEGVKLSLSYIRDIPKDNEFLEDRIAMALAKRHKCLEHNGPGSGPCKTDRERAALVMQILKEDLA